MNDIGSQRKWVTQAENCLAVVREVHNAVCRGVPADHALSEIFHREHKYGSRDRRFFRDAVFSWYRWLGFLRNSPLANAPLQTQILASFLADGEPLPPACETWVCKAHDYSAAPLRVWHGVDAGWHECLPDGTWQMLPHNIYEHLKKNMTVEDLQSYLVSLMSRSPVWCRVCREHREEVLREWDECGYTYQQHPLQSNAFQFKNDRLNFAKMRTARLGFFEVQDFSSQCIGLAAGPKTGEQWFDACAGGGGKTLQLADLMNGQGRISVYDIRSHKIDDLFKRAANSPFAKMLVREGKGVPERQFDGVLIDAPCSSSGRWRRNPEIKFMPQVMSREKLLNVQADLLESLSKCVKCGGKLVYATCSVCREENQDQVNAFLSRHYGEFEPCPFASPHDGSVLASGMLLTVPAGATRAGTTKVCYAHPKDADCDGSFVAVLRRVHSTQI